MKTAIRTVPLRLATVSAAALMAASPALAQQADGAAWVEITNWRAAAATDGWSADRALDTDVIGSGGEVVGELEDIIVGPDGRIESVIVEGGGFADIGDVHAAVPWSEVSMVDPERVEVAVAEEDLDEAERYENMDDMPPKPMNFRVRELMGDFVTANGVGYGAVDDVLFDPEGEIVAVVVYPSAAYRRRPVAVPYNATAYDPYGPYFAVPYTSVQLDELPPYEPEDEEG
ncbi:MAG TPA: PRC-barrel domain-containing protein [Paracoccaceae bacterium]|nr:PRC-barrel domain-containing protein [Paracoccaceae bacterium]